MSDDSTSSTQRAGADAPAAPSSEAPPSGAPPSSSASGTGAAASNLPRLSDAGPRRLSDVARALAGVAAVLDAAATASAAGPRGGGGGAAQQAPGGAVSGAAAAASQRRRQRMREAQGKLAHMQDSLIRSLDIAAYCEMSVGYYMDNSMALLLVRLLPHWLFYTPKPSFFPPPPTRRPYVLASALTTMLCAASHLLMPPPQAGEAARGYLHGGFLIDFVGELGPVSKVRLVAADVAVLLLQMLLLAVVLEREALRSSMALGGVHAALDLSRAARDALMLGPESGQGQDHDAEEQGILRRDEPGGGAHGLSAVVEEDDGGSGGGGDDAENDGDDEDEGAPLASAGGGGEDDAALGPRMRKHHLDDLHSGHYVVANLYVFDAVRRSWWWNYER